MPPQDRRARSHAKSLHGEMHTACGKVRAAVKMASVDEEPTCRGCVNVLDLDHKDKVMGKSVVNYRTEE